MLSHARDHDHHGSYLWKSSFILALSLHGLVFLCALISPFLLNRVKRLPEAYTVNLVSLPAPGQTAPPAPVPAAMEQPAPPPAAEKEPESAPQPKAQPTPKPALSPPKARNETPAPAPPSVAKDISLTPIKVKKTPAAETVSRKEKLEKIEAIKKEHLLKKAMDAEEKARSFEIKAKQTAVENLRQMLKAKTLLNKGQGTVAADSQGASATRAGAAAGALATPATVMGQYLADVHQRVQAHWVLPPLHNWKDPLSVVLIIQIQPGGEITRMFFEQKSTNSFFNQFVLKTVKDSVPMPRFPQEIREDSIEIGLRFKPGGLF